MAINPEIALSVRPFQAPQLDIPDPVEQFGKVLTLQNLMQQRQSGALKLEGQQLELQQARQAAQERADMAKYLQELGAARDAGATATAGTPGGAPGTAAPAAYDYNDLMRRFPIHGPGLVKSIHEAQKAHLDEQEQQWKVQQNQNMRRAQLAATITDEPSKISALATARQENLINDKQLDQLRNVPADSPVWRSWQMEALKADEALSQTRADLKARIEQEVQAHNRAMYPAQEAEATSKAEEAALTASAARRSQNAMSLAGALRQGPQAFADAFAKLSPEDQEPFAGAKTETDLLRAAMKPAEAASSAETGRHNLIQEQNERARLSISREEQNLRQRQFDSTYGAMVDPNTGKLMDADAAKAIASQDPLAVAIANYQAAPPTTSRGGPGASVMRKVLAINPDYQAQNWQAQGAQLKNFTSGKVSKELRAANTALGHIGLLNDAVDALNNGDIRLLNEFANRLGLETGKTPAAVFKTIAGKVGPELAQAYGEATGGERSGERANFDAALPPQTLRANAAVSARLLKGKLDSTRFQWQSTPGFEKRQLPMISPEAQHVLDNLTPAQGGGSKTQANPNPSGYIPGHVYGGLKYLGGDPNQQSSWTK